MTYSQYRKIKPTLNLTDLARATGVSYGIIRNLTQRSYSEHIARKITAYWEEHYGTASKDRRL